jgi:hypothetical protein
MDMNDSSNQLVYQDRPILSWVIGGLAILSGIYIFIASGSIISALPLLLFALLILMVFSAANTITADRFRRVLTVSSKSLFGKKVQEFVFNEIANFEVEASRNLTTNRSRSVNYRLVLVKTNGEKFPLQNLFTANYADKARKAKALCEYLNLPGWEDKPTNLFQSAMQSQVTLTSQPTMTREDTTSGVTWKIESHSIGGKPVTRWISPDYTCPNGFLLIAQKPAGSTGINTSGGLLGSLMLMAYRQVLGLYGFLPSDTPGFDNAQAINTPDDQFNQNFYALSSQENLGSSLLNQWTIIPLKNWSDRHPLKSINTNDQFGQLAVLFSPRGVQAAVLGSLPDDQFDELISIGVDLVKAQGGGNPQV